MSRIEEKPSLRLVGPDEFEPPPGRDTPAMRQYYRFKREHPGCVLFFRIGDFYELFDDDAVTAHKALGLTLTRRSEGGAPMAGVPHHSAENYFRRMLEQGFRVAVCDQTEDAALAKGVVQRAVTRVLTPGALVDESLLRDDRPNALAAVLFLADEHAAAAVIEVSTGSFRVFDATPDRIAAELARLAPSELLFAETADGQTPARTRALLEAINAAHPSGSCAPSARPSWHFRREEALDALRRRFGVASLAGFGLSDSDPSIGAAGAALRFILETQAPGIDHDAPSSAASARSIPHLQPPRRDEPSDYLVLDAASLRSLEIERTIRAPSPDASGAGGARVDRSLVGLFLAGPPAPRTSMGKRLVREWLCRPLAVRARIEERLDRVAFLVNDAKTLRAVRETLGEVQDVARIGARAALGRATPRDLVALGRSLATIDALATLTRDAGPLGTLGGALDSVRAALSPLAQRILAQCVESPPHHLREGGLIRPGVDAELDECRGLERDATAWLADYQARLATRFDLPGIKVGFNRVFGYYIELPRAQSRRAPEELIRKQTLKNAERYTTPELKEFEEKVTTARSRAVAREQTLFDALCADARAAAADLRAFAEAAATLDALACFASKAAREAGWTRPVIVDAPVIDIVQGRHPVLDELLAGEFVPNDLRLGVGELFDIHEKSEGASERSPSPAQPSLHSLALITGPNMGGKSTYIRQSALLTILAHAGAFLPAQRAVIGLTDRVFTRVGADDALHAGQSTFMVEMTETANILHHATERSLVILDEIGRGTSTLDGLALAWAIAERLAGACASDTRSLDASMPRSLPSPRTLFATHYHEITRLEDELPGRVINLHVAVKEWTPAAPAAPLEQEGVRAQRGQVSGADAAAHPEVIFLHRILPGRADRSYGVHVARLAGLPAAVVARARELLESLSVSHAQDGAARAGEPSSNALSSPPVGEDVDAKRREERGRAAAPLEPSLFASPLPHPVVEELKKLDLDNMTPLQAFDALRKLKHRAD